MILKWKTEDDFWCYEDLGDNFAIHRGGVDVPEIHDSKQILSDGLEAKIHRYLTDKLGLNQYARILSGHIDGFREGSYGFTVVTNEEKILVLLGQQAYIMSESGKTIDRI